MIFIRFTTVNHLNLMTNSIEVETLLLSRTVDSFISHRLKMCLFSATVPTFLSVRAALNKIVKYKLAPCDQISIFGLKIFLIDNVFLKKFLKRSFWRREIELLCYQNFLLYWWSTLSQCKIIDFDTQLHDRLSLEKSMLDEVWVKVDTVSQ